MKYPKGKVPPQLATQNKNEYYEEAEAYIEKHFPNNYGKTHSTLIYPTTFEESRAWLHRFFETQFTDFGSFEDAIVSEESILHHSVLSPMMNVGLLTPDFILNETITYANKHNIPLNSIEGFVRQILGWREFIRAVYELRGNEERTTNFWKFKRKIPKSFWNGTTGIIPIDATIKKTLETGYCHHIERLMVLGNFMLLCEFDPNEVYVWFMEMFVDAYDWVMVPNVYGMSQFADGGIMATKPYISGSNYLMKMSNYPKGEWQQIWDSLFWRFMHIHRDFFLQNPRLGMLIKSFDKMPKEKQDKYIKTAEDYMLELHD
jgi:deoxyribodipyrimidine photolyase-related protein